MTKRKCQYCAIPNNKLTVDNYFSKLKELEGYVKDNRMELIFGDCPLENISVEISKEQKFAYYHYFKCACGNFLRCGISVRSRNPIVEIIPELPKGIHK